MAITKDVKGRESWKKIYIFHLYYTCLVDIMESVDSISRDGPDTPYAYIIH